MSALIVPIAPVREAVKQVNRLQAPELRATAVNMVLDEVRQGHNGMCVAHHLRMQRLQAQAPEIRA